MLAKVFIIASFCVAASLQHTPIVKCGSGHPAPSELRVEGCNKLPCLFIRGKDVVAEWDFDVVTDTEHLKPVVKAKVVGIPMPVPPLPEQDACKSLGNKECPLSNGDRVTYALKMPVLAAYPKVTVELTFSLVDNNNNVHVCFVLKAKVVD